MLKNIIRQLREAHNLTQEDIAQYLHVQRTTYTRYENGTNNLNFDALCKLADLYNVSTDFLLERKQYNNENIDLEFLYMYNNASPIFKDIALTILKKGQEYNFSDNKLKQSICIPVFSKDIIGLPIEMIQDKLNNNLIQEEKISIGDFAIIASDDSMSNANINNGDYVIIRPQSNINIGEIALLLFDNRSMIRNISERNGSLVLVAANEDYSPILCNSAEDIHIIGRVIKIIKNKT